MEVKEIASAAPPGVRCRQVPGSQLVEEVLGSTAAGDPGHLRVVPGQTPEWSMTVARNGVRGAVKPSPATALSRSSNLIFAPTGCRRLEWLSAAASRRATEHAEAGGVLAAQFPDVRIEYEPPDGGGAQPPRQCSGRPRRDHVSSFHVESTPATSQPPLPPWVRSLDAELVEEIPPVVVTARRGKRPGLCLTRPDGRRAVTR